MSERFKELVLKTSDSFIWAVGSNPTLSAKYGEVPKGLRGQFAKLLGRFPAREFDPRLLRQKASAKADAFFVAFCDALF